MFNKFYEFGIIKHGNFEDKKIYERKGASIF
jgi:hypothetical protein